MSQPRDNRPATIALIAFSICGIAGPYMVIVDILDPGLLGYHSTDSRAMAQGYGGILLSGLYFLERIRSTRPAGKIKWRSVVFWIVLLLGGVYTALSGGGFRVVRVIAGTLTVVGATGMLV